MHECNGQCRFPYAKDISLKGRSGLEMKVAKESNGTPQVVQWQRIPLQMQVARDVGAVPRLGRSPGEGDGN